MATALKPYEQRKAPVRTQQQSFVTMRVDGQLFGASVYAVQDILRAQNIATIPLSPYVVEGSLNLRGRIVTALNLRKRLGLLPSEEDTKSMHVVLEFHDELYSLMVDSVGDVLSIPLDAIDKTPVNLHASWRELAAGVHQLDGELLVLFDIQALLTFDASEA